MKIIKNMSLKNVDWEIVITKYHILGDDCYGWSLEGKVPDVDHLLSSDNVFPNEQSAEENVYLYRHNYSDNLDAMANGVLNYLMIIKKEMSLGVLFNQWMQRCVIDLPSKNAREARVGIFDLQGRLILRRIILHHGDASYHTDIGKLNLSQGLYTGRLIHTDQSIPITFKRVSP